MKAWNPASLVQVHYHDRLAGVNKVIGLYAKAFESLGNGRASANLLVCAQSQTKGADFRPAKVKAVAFCDYRTFASKSQFYRIKSLLLDSLDNVLKARTLRRPVCVIGHNVSIGKNCGLSAAFAEIARRYAGEKDNIRFYSVIHDFAEEGRLDCLAEIEKVKKWTDIERDLFPSAGVVGLITLNEGNAAVLEKAGFPAWVLNNPVEIAHSALQLVEGRAQRPVHFDKLNERRHFLFSKYRTTSLSKGAYSHRELPIILYPSRCISRKNILESILLCNFIYKSNLILGGSGTNARDKIAFNKAFALCKKYRLPILFDYGRIFADKSEKGVFTDKAFGIADACISTSIAEGFGYGLYEPWLYGKAVFGRKYLGFEPIAGVKFHGLYDRLPIPIKWISVSKLRDRYWEVMHKCFGSGKNNALLSNRKKFDRAFSDYFIKNSTIDFGSLDSETQFPVLESLVRSPQKIEEWELHCEDQLSAIRKSVAIALHKSEKTIRYNQGRINKFLSLNSFSKEFGKVLSQNPPKKSKDGSREEILRQFCDFDRFRLLLAK